MTRSPSAVAWFYRVLRNAVIDHHRRASARSRSLEALARELATRSRTGSVRAKRAAGGFAR